MLGVFSERLTAALAPVTRRAMLGFSEADELRRFDFAVRLTLFVWAKLPVWLKNSIQARNRVKQPGDSHHAIDHPAPLDAE